MYTCNPALFFFVMPGSLQRKWATFSLQYFGWFASKSVDLIVKRAEAEKYSVRNSPHLSFWSQQKLCVYLWISTWQPRHYKDIQQTSSPHTHTRIYGCMWIYKNIGSKSWKNLGNELTCWLLSYLLWRRSATASFNVKVHKLHATRAR